MIRKNDSQRKILKGIMTEKKTRLPSLRNHDWKIVKVETRNINELINHITTNNITELNKLIYSVVKLVCDKIGVLSKNMNRNSDPEWEIWLETQIRNLRPQAKTISQRKNAKIWDEKKKVTQVKQTIQLEEIN